MLLRLLDRFFAANPILAAVWIGIDPARLHELTHQDGPR
jgi:hypothetical protein